MAKVILTKESRMADRILRCLPKKTQVAAELGIAGYEIREKGEP